METNYKQPFQVFAEMIAAGDDAIKLAPMSNIDSINVHGGTGYVTFGVPPEIAMKILDHSEDFIGGFILCERKDYERYQKLPS